MSVMYIILVSYNLATIFVFGKNNKKSRIYKI